MKKYQIALAAALIMSPISSTFAKPNFYAGAGIGKLKVSKPKVKNSQDFETGSIAYNVSLGMDYPLANNLSVDAGVGYTFDSQKLAEGYCNLVSGAVVRCEGNADSKLISIPVTLNYNLPVANQIGLVFGGGASAGRFSREYSLSAPDNKNVETLTETVAEKWRVTPVAKIGLTFNQFKLQAEHHFKIGNTEAGEGSASLITLQMSGF